MAYDARLAERVREALAAYPGVEERKMFGGLSFLLQGHMCCGVVRDDLVIRTGPAGQAAALARPHAREMDFTGKPLKGFVYVGSEGVASDPDLQSWIDGAVRFVRTLPAK
jgi:TfoX/Sxy family transcriptional regulator of competence genes